MYDQALLFYLKRPITLVQYIDEFALGLQIAVAGLPMRVLARDPRRVIVSRQ